LGGIDKNGTANNRVYTARDALELKEQTRASDGADRAIQDLAKLEAWGYETGRRKEPA
jgi:hypothetical protein